MSNNYPQVTLGQLLTKSDETIVLQPEKHYKQITVKWWGKGVTLRKELSGTEIASSRQFLVRTNQFVISKIDARKGACAIVPASFDGAVVSQDFPVYSLNHTQIQPKYLDWLSKTSNFVSICEHASEGTTNRVRLKFDKFLATQIPLPPLEEQHRIVARIEELARKVEEAKSLRREAIEEREALLEGTIDTTFRQIQQFERQTLAELTTKIGSGSTPLGGRSSYQETGIPFIRSLNVRMRSFTWNDLAFIDEVTHTKMQNTRVKPLDILLNITGASIGRVTCAPENIKEANVNQHVSIIRPKQELNPFFLMYWISQTSVQKYIQDEQKGATRQGFTKAQIEALKIPLPPLSEQRRIVTHLDNLQAQIGILKRKQAETEADLNALLPSILDKAFKGEL